MASAPCRPPSRRSSSGRALTESPGSWSGRRTASCAPRIPGRASRSTWCPSRRAATSRAGAGSTPASRTGRRSSSRRRAAVRSGARSVPSGRLHDRQFRERSIDAVCRDFGGRRRSRLHRRRSVLAPWRAQRGAGDRADPARPAQAVGARAEPRRHGGAAARAARGVASVRARVRRLLRPRSADRRRPDQAEQGHDRRVGCREGIRVARERRPRRHRQLRDRSRVGRARVRAAVGVRRAGALVAGRLHHPDAAARHGLL